jgi:hypothetical protein
MEWDTVLSGRGTGSGVLEWEVATVLEWEGATELEEELE